MTTQKTNVQKAAQFNIDAILPENTDLAMRVLFDISKRLIDITDREEEKIAEDDFVGLSLMQDEKRALANRYETASLEFMNRIEEFRKMDKSLLGKLENLQKTLGDKARANAAKLEIMLEKLSQNTHTTLLNVQSLAQEGGASYPNKRSAGTQERETA